MFEEEGSICFSIPEVLSQCLYTEGLKSYQHDVQISFQTPKASLTISYSYVY